MKHVNLSSYLRPTKEQIERAKHVGDELHMLVRDHRVSQQTKEKIVFEWLKEGADIFAPLTQGKSSVPYFVVECPHTKFLEMHNGPWGDIHTRLFLTSLEVDNPKAIEFFMARKPPLHRMDITLLPVLHHRKFLEAFLERGVGFGAEPLTCKTIENLLSYLDIDTLIDAFEFIETYKKKYITRKPLRHHNYKVPWEEIANMVGTKDFMRATKVAEKHKVSLVKLSLLNHCGIHGDFFFELFKKNYKTLKARDLQEILFSRSIGNASWLFRNISYLTSNQVQSIYDISKERGLASGWKDIIKHRKTSIPLLADIERLMERESIATAVSKKHFEKAPVAPRKRKM